MKRKPIVAAILVAVTLYACKKNLDVRSLQSLGADTSITEDSVYKGKIEQLLNIKLRPSTVEERDTSNHSVIHLPFKTFKEEYAYLDSVLSHKSLFKITVPMTRTVTATRLSTKALAGTGTPITVSYSSEGIFGALIDGSPVAEAAASIEFTFDYAIQFTPDSLGTAYASVVTENSGSPTNYAISSTLGFAYGAPESTASLIPSGAGGSMTGSILAELEDDGDTGEIEIYMSGTYHISVPSTPTGGSGVSMSAEASLSPE